MLVSHIQSGTIEILKDPSDTEHKGQQACVHTHALQRPKKNAHRHTDNMFAHKKCENNLVWDRLHWASQVDSQHISLIQGCAKRSGCTHVFYFSALRGGTSIKPFVIIVHSQGCL